jgi:hypothetical protein
MFPHYKALRFCGIPFHGGVGYGIQKYVFDPFIGVWFAYGLCGNLIGSAVNQAADEQVYIGSGDVFDGVAADLTENRRLALVDLSNVLAPNNLPFCVTVRCRTGGATRTP